MIPIVLDPSQVRLALVGKGELAVRRLSQLRDGGAVHLTVFSTQPDPELAGLAGDRLIHRLPEREELSLFAAVWVVGHEPATAATLAHAGRAEGALMNVKDLDREIGG